VLIGDLLIVAFRKNRQSEIVHHQIIRSRDSAIAFPKGRWSRLTLDVRSDGLMSKDRLEDILTGQQGEPPNMLQGLLAVQEALGYVPLEELPTIARLLGVTEADVAGVLSYYPDLRRDPPARHVVRLCMGESCFANHCGRILSELQERLRVGVGETSPGHRFRLEQVFCMGNCAVGPTMAIDGDLFGRVAASQIPDLLKRYQ
jgi:NADH:ubiquinone oxidoreductase subunit E